MISKGHFFEGGYWLILRHTHRIRSFNQSWHVADWKSPPWILFKQHIDEWFGFLAILDLGMTGCVQSFLRATRKWFGWNLVNK